MRESERDRGGRWRRLGGALPYPVVCVLLGLLLGWTPRLVHGPIAEKFNVHYIHGAVAVWAFYTARLLVAGLARAITGRNHLHDRGP